MQRDADEIGLMIGPIGDAIGQWGFLATIHASTVGQTATNAAVNGASVRFARRHCCTLFEERARFSTASSVASSRTHRG